MRWQDDRRAGYDDPDWHRALDDGTDLTERTPEDARYEADHGWTPEPVDGHAA